MGDTMQAVVFREFGAPEQLVVAEVPRPAPGASDVLVRVEAAGICYHDLLDRAGKLPDARPGRILGHEIAGEVVEVGPQVVGVAPGQRVVLFQRIYCGRCRYCLSGRHDLCRDSGVLGSHVDGGYAEYVCAPAVNAIVLPDEVDWVAGALGVCPIGTSVRAALGVAGLSAGQTALVTGASGGLGLHEIQIARTVGARVIAVTSSEDKAAAIRAVGADDVVVSPDLRFSGAVWRLTEKQGVDVVLDNVVTGTLGESLRSLGALGLAVVLGNVGVSPLEVNPGLIIGRRLRIAGSGNATYEDVRRGLQMLANGQIRAQVGHVLPFPRAAEAHALLEGRGVVGRVVLRGW
jgi:acryloyl-coenzyme A reductase